MLRRSVLILATVYIAAAVTGLARERRGAIATGLRVHRFTRGHLTLQLTIARRGLYVSRTPDGVWWMLRMRSGKCPPVPWWPGDDPPPDIGVREPRRPTGPGPIVAAATLDPRSNG